MIVFERLELKNFISVGDNPLQIIVNKSPTTLITGMNGVGKSSVMADAFSFVLFGKSFRGVNKAALINTINQRDSYVKMTLRSGQNSYEILRGQKPARLEIKKDGVLMNENASVSDTQAYIETDILGFDFSTFIRVCILSTMNYVPFMQLSSYERRNFVETMLSLKTFTDMNKIHKANMSTLKDKIVTLDKAIGVLQTSQKEKKETLTLLETIGGDRAKGMKSAADAMVEKLSALCDRIGELNKKIAEMTDLAPDENIQLIKSRISQLDQKLRQFDAENNHDEKRISDLSGKHNCESCLQDISVDQSAAIVESIRSTIEKRKHIANTEIVPELRDLRSDILVYGDHKSTLEKLKSDLDYALASKKILAADIKKTVSKIEEAKDDAMVAKVRCDLSVIEDNLRRKSKKFDEYKSAIEVGSIVSDLLKDTGIKGTIIKQYIPLLVGYVNHYLEKLNISIKFSMDENFNETITTRYANEYTYSNLSAGERARIDLAIAFAWRQIAKLKNSVYCNLLVLDEVADASLDVNGTEDLMAILEEITSDTNVFIISHKAHLDEHVRSVLRLEKHNGFTRIA